MAPAGPWQCWRVSAGEEHSERSGIGPSHRPAGPLTTFIGRAPEVDAASDLLAHHRLVTLTGPGGAGKTRLAVEVASKQTSRHADGVWWVDLSMVTESADVAGALATAVGAPIVGEQARTLCAFLANRESLLCLDNAEHLLDRVAQLADAMLRGCPHLRILVTSREPLGVPGEAVLGVPPLTDDDAVALFVDRARLVQHTFVLDGSNEPAVRSIAAHLDGIPLALELAAAWMRTLTPQQVEAGLDDRFSLLVRGPRGAQRRQLTLAGSIDWSHALLDEIDRAVFRRLSVFAGSFGVAAAQELCAGGVVTAGEALPALGRLVDKSLVVVESRDGEARYRLLETIRAYAGARAVAAKERDALRGRHLGWYLGYAEAAESERERDTDRWRNTLAVEYDNLAAALEFGLAAEDPTSGRRLAAALAWFWHFDRRGREGLAVLGRAIDCAPEERSPLQARLLTGFALVADTAGPLDVEYDAASRAAELAADVGDDNLRALCLNLVAVGAFYVDFEEAWRLCEQAHEIARASGNIFVRGASRALQAMILHLRDRHAEAEAIVDGPVREALQHHRGILSTLLIYQADGAFATGEPARAEELARQALRIAEPLGDYLRLGFARSMLAQIIALRGDTARAAEVLDPIMRLAGNADIFVPGLDHAAAVVSTLAGDPGSAINWLRRPAGSTERGAATWLAGRALPRLGAALAAAGRTEEAAAVLGRAIDIARRVQLPGALAEALFAQAELAAAEPDGSARAVELHHAALAIRVDHGLRTAQLDSVEALARIGEATADSVRVLSAAQGERQRIGVPRSAAEQDAYDSAAADLRRALGDNVFDEAAAEGLGLPLDQAVTHVRRTRGRRDRPATGWASLTPTELEVARVVTEGLSNPQVGARLFMSRGTVKTHLSHIYAKLGVANRTELAAASRRQSEPTASGSGAGTRYPPSDIEVDG